MAQLQKHSEAACPVASIKSADENIHLLQVDEDMLGRLCASVHEALNRCGGYMYHSSLQEGMATLQTLGAVSKRPSRITRPAYIIDEQAALTPMLAQMQASDIGRTIVDLSSCTNRFYKTSGGVAASSWLKQRWANLAVGRSDVTVEQFSHPNWPQKSVIMTIRGADNARAVVVMGAPGFNQRRRRDRDHGGTGCRR